jgi:UDP-N-acetyl-D-mannosaminuronic acid dehydrogenase
MRVCVVGLGYIGLPTAAMLALGGHDVMGYDIDAGLLASLGNGSEEIREAAVRDCVESAMSSGKLRLTDTIWGEARAFVICVPTPTVDHKPDLSYITVATREVAKKLKAGDLVVLESTVPPGTMDRVVVPILKGADVDLDSVAVSHCPERVIPGDIVRELRENHRVVGGRKPGDAELARDLYLSFCSGDISMTDNVTAELSKVIENTYRDVNIAFANELALLSEEVGVDARTVIALANKHPRVNILSPGPGVGGHCIPVDPHFLSNANPFLTELIQTARRINERMPHVIVKRIMEFVPPREGARIAILGAAYKANVDDTRESPTQRVEELLHERRYETRVFDPLASRYNGLLTSSLEETVSGSDAIVLMVGHDEYKKIDPAFIAPLCRSLNLIDAQAHLQASAWERAGFSVYVLGGERRSRVAVPASA